MATWKKVIVSGSDAILNKLNVGTNQQITTAQSTTFLTGSFTGSFKGDGSGLTGLSSANNTTITLTAGTGMSGGGDFTTNQSGAEEITFTNAGVTSNVAGGGITVSGATGAVTIAVNSGSILPFISSSVFSTVSGDITINAAGVAAIGSEVIVNADIADSTIDLTAKVTGTLPVANGGTGINSLGTGVATFLGTPSSANLRSAVTDETGTGALVFATSPALVTPDIGAATGTSLVLSGDLTVNGDLVTLNTANLNIEDKFILLNSGSSTATDESGIIFGGANGTAGSGSALIWNGDYNDSDGRLAIANSVGATDSTATVSYYIAGVFDGTSDDAATAQADHNGNIRIESGDIFIYS